ncbi:MAG TPA: ATP-binding domain-containing protein, partial [Gaiellaceae bacterium]|nr:ATP-binding domain-containing protein [Gaiellaceae bacterium]
YVRVREREVRELLAAVRDEHGTSAAARERFRMALVRRFYADYAHVHAGAAVMDGEQVERALRTSGVLRAALDAAWPAVSPERLLRALFTDVDLLEEAADGVLDRDEQRLLRRRGSGWSDADVALLDEAQALVGEPPRTYGHVVVDEAQDLTPLQLRAVGRRARDGALTMLGDVAQATGPVAYASWTDVLPFLPRGDDATVEELRHAYRVPRELMEFALPLLAEIAPGVEPPVAYRTGAAAPLVRRVEPAELVAETYRQVARLAEADGLVAVIAPDELHDELVLFQHKLSALDDLPVLTARGSKGLEFDHVIVVEPALVAGRPQGLRELYVALTRPTKSLTVLHARPLPAPLA